MSSCLTTVVSMTRNPYFKTPGDDVWDALNRKYLTLKNFFQNNSFQKLAKCPTFSQKVYAF